MSKSEVEDRFRVYSSIKDSFQVLFAPFAVAVFVWADINMYVIERKPIGFAFVVSLILIVICSILSVFIYSLYGNRMKVSGDDIRITKWNLRTVKCSVYDIDRIVFEKRDNSEYAVNIYIGDFSFKFTDIEKGYKDLSSYLCKKLSQSSIEYVTYDVPPDKE